MKSTPDIGVISFPLASTNNFLQAYPSDNSQNSSKVSWRQNKDLKVSQKPPSLRQCFCFKKNTPIRIKGPVSYRPPSKKFCEIMYNRSVYGVGKKGMFEQAAGTRAICKTSYYKTPFPGDKKSKINIGVPCVIKEDLNGVFHEVEILKKLNHPNIIKLIPSKNNGKSTTKFIMENGGEDTLGSILNGRTVELNYKDRVGIFAQIVDAIQYLNNEEFFLFYLHLGNIVLKTNGKISIIDFGSGEKINESIKKRQELKDIGCVHICLERLVGEINTAHLKPHEAIHVEKLKAFSFKIQKLSAEKDSNGCQLVILQLLEALRSMPDIFPKWECLEGAFIPQGSSKSL